MKKYPLRHLYVNTYLYSFLYDGCMRDCMRVSKQQNSSRFYEIHTSSISTSRNFRDFSILRRNMETALNGVALSATEILIFMPRTTGN